VDGLPFAVIYRHFRAFLAGFLHFASFPVIDRQELASPGAFLRIPP
jgi:hypothetical protein